MWVIIGQITWLHANYRHLDRFWPFLGHSGPQIPNLGVPFLANFFSSKYRHVGCPERCHVMPGLSATFSNGRDPLRGSKRQKSRFYGHYGPQIPIFGTSFSANFFFSSKYGHVGCPERCHVIPGLSATLSNAREPTQRLKTAKKSILWPFWTQNPNFSAVLSCWVGPLGLPCDIWALRNLFKPKGPNQWLIMAKKLGFKVQNDRKNDFFAVLSLWVGSLAFEKVAERPGITWHRSGHPTCPYFEEKKKLAENEVPKIGIWGP